MDFSTETIRLSSNEGPKNTLKLPIFKSRHSLRVFKEIFNKSPKHQKRKYSRTKRLLFVTGSSSKQTTDNYVKCIYSIWFYYWAVTDQFIFPKLAFFYSRCLYVRRFLVVYFFIRLIGWVLFLLLKKFKRACQRITGLIFFAMGFGISVF